MLIETSWQFSTSTNNDLFELDQIENENNQPNKCLHYLENGNNTSS